MKKNTGIRDWSPSLLDLNDVSGGNSMRTEEHTRWFEEIVHTGLDALYSLAYVPVMGAICRVRVCEASSRYSSRKLEIWGIKCHISEVENIAKFPKCDSYFMMDV